MPLTAYRRNGQPLVFRHGCDTFQVWPSVLTTQQKIDLEFLAPKSAEIVVDMAPVDVRAISGTGGWIQVVHENESAYVDLRIAGTDRVEMTFDAPPTFIVEH